MLISHDLDLLIFILIAEYMLILDFSGYNVGNVLPLQFFTDPVKRGFDSNSMVLSSKNSNWILINHFFFFFDEWRNCKSSEQRFQGWQNIMTGDIITDEEVETHVILCWVVLLPTLPNSQSNYFTSSDWMDGCFT